MREKETRKLSLNPEILYKAGAVVFGIMLAITLTRNILIISNANSDTQKLKSDIEKLKAENEDIREKIETASTEEFIEKQARDQLGLVMGDETVVILPDEEILKKFSPRLQSEEESLPDPNWKKWMKLFI